ncbi:MAG: radical SAM peptide maturase [Bacteroidales bacterium]|jgi:uncharacterized protein|nr:radical SAM peptide maturase [Bacteroidales bacterium]
MNPDNFTQTSGKLIENNLKYLKSLVFEVTDQCNLNCKYCGLAELYTGYDERKNKMFSFEKAKSIINYLFKLWGKNYSHGCIFPVSIGFYGGEPLLNTSFIKKVIEYLEHSENVGKRFSYSMTTNAVLLDKHIDYLADKKIRLLISLDGDKTAQSYRVDHSGNNSFDKVFKNVKALQRKYPNYFKELVNFNAVLHNRNNVESIYKFFKINFDKIPQISPLNTLGIRKNKIEKFKQMYQNTYESFNKAIDCESLESEMFSAFPKTYALIDYIYNRSGNVFIKYNDLFVDSSNMNYIPTATCTPFMKKMFITVNGKVLQCERIDHDFELGYVYDDHVELDFEYIAAQHNKHVFKCVKQCANCAIKFHCTQCVYYIPDIRNDNPHCFNICSKKESEKQDVEIFQHLAKHPYYYEKILDEIELRF